jgi:hypothetical protein
MHCTALFCPALQCIDGSQPFSSLFYPFRSVLMTKLSSILSSSLLPHPPLFSPPLSSPPFSSLLLSCRLLSSPLLTLLKMFLSSPLLSSPHPAKEVSLHPYD